MARHWLGTEALMTRRGNRNATISTMYLLISMIKFTVSKKINLRLCKAFPSLISIWLVSKEKTCSTDYDYYITQQRITGATRIRCNLKIMSGIEYFAWI